MMLGLLALAALPAVMGTEVTIDNAQPRRDQHGNILSAFPNTVNVKMLT